MSGGGNFFDFFSKGVGTEIIKISALQGFICALKFLLSISWNYLFKLGS